jgi:hypothetical protein
MTTPRFVYVTSSDRRDVFERLRTEFAFQPEICVIQDRRRGERRQTAGGAASPERRRRDRRGHGDLEQELRSVGSFIATIEDLRPWQ